MKNTSTDKISENNAREIEMRMMNDPRYKRMTEQPVDHLMPIRHPSVDELSIALLRL